MAFAAHLQAPFGLSILDYVSLVLRMGGGFSKTYDADVRGRAYSLWSGL
jgi:hypothetical protein